MNVGSRLFSNVTKWRKITVLIRTVKADLWHC